MKHEAFAHSKVGRLCRALKIEPWGARGIVQSVWHVASIESPRGDIGKMADEDIAYQIGWQGDPGVLVSALVVSGWLDESDEFRLVIHDWSQHCEDSVHSKLARAGATFYDGTHPKTHRLTQEERARIRARPHVPAPPPPPAPEPVAATPARKATKPRAVPAATATDTEFDTFFECCPRKKKKLDAFKAWKQTAKDRPPLDRLLIALRALINEARRKGGNWADFFPYPASLLRAHFWNDEVLTERMGHAGPMTVPVPALFAAAPPALEPEPDPIPANPDDIERESWVDTFRSHGIPDAADEAESCSMERLRELQAIHTEAIERKRAEALARIRAGRLVA